MILHPTELLGILAKPTEYYNESYRENHDPEIDKVLQFGRDHGNVFGRLDRTDLKAFIVPECVGEGGLTEPPNKYVKKASEVLRGELGIAYDCEKCRSDKKERCKGIQPANHDFQDFESLIRILYQIRCNLFHGEKLDPNEWQKKRNQKLVRKGNIALKIILEEVAGE
ncbi:MAG: hypothetical protein KAR39_05325 [Thermoplasmata archaeon]|nr:hypothetical protein [Thermoplasmata archaeon]